MKFSEHVFLGIIFLAGGSICTTLGIGHWFLFVGGVIVGMIWMAADDME
jgi:hypothetical protein